MTFHDKNLIDFNRPKTFKEEHNDLNKEICLNNSELDVSSCKNLEVENSPMVLFGVGINEGFIRKNSTTGNLNVEAGSIYSRKSTNKGKISRAGSIRSIRSV